jgi:tetratricopeptide (TPR) repeat protein
MKLRLLIIALLISATQGTFAQSKKKRSEALDKAKAEGNYPEALRLINENIDKEPKNEWNYIERSQLYLEMGKAEDAYLNAEKAIIINPANGECYNTLGSIFQAVGDFENAEKCYTKAYDITPPDSTRIRMAYILNRSTALGHMRKFDDAYKYAMVAYNADSNDIGVLNNLAALLDDVGKQEEGMRLLKKVVMLDSTFIGGYINIGFKYSQMGEYEKSLPYFDKAIALDPKTGITYNNRGYSKLKLGRLEDALKDVNHSLELYPGNSYAYRNRALIYIAMKRMNMACADIEKALAEGFTTTYGDEVEKLKAANCK